ncbi:MULTISPECIES: PLP-dependent aminotransferase family protein [Raoultella]|uniref:MocR-like pyridoxine biosynthesis transcription factor PdxR n=1 Tax=Raoultella TaxID=160674 RepID=UPI00216A3BC3|nr:MULTISPECIES: PLP-dependent aminotransferase family protein [Raoultella]MCS4270049.1 GntR family transcriptional regulator/MocR family aminotransferase [Raoultella sp. BIGb0132]MCS4287009.1 GntR family transcriptional regulator/MocR family aminotransferase [Raoultella terrigena]
MKINTLTMRLEKKPAIYKQLFEFIKGNIIEGRFLPGDSLPSSRNLACDMSISRTSVLNAYNALIAEGFIVSQQGSGYRVNARPGGTPAGAAHAPAVARSHRQRYLPFSPWPVDTSFFPAHKWAKIIAKVARTTPLSLVNTSQYDQFGNRQLREVLCHYLYEKKGIICTPQQVIVTTGSMESLEMCLNAVTAAGQMVSIEDPFYPSLRRYLLKNNRLVHYMAVDEQGARCDTIPGNSRLAIITPGNQFPLGVTMSTPRKRAFAEWAERNHAWIIEDDYDTDFNQQPQPALAAEDKYRRTIYLGNFSKLITSDLRIGFIVLPEGLVPSFQRMEYALKTSYLPQLILAEFIRSGDFYRHLLKARSIYSEKRAFFISLLERELAAYGRVFRDPAGSLVVFELAPERVDTDIARRAEEQGLSLRALSPLCQDVRRNGLVLGFIYFNREVLRIAVRELKSILAGSAKDDLPGVAQ